MSNVHGLLNPSKARFFLHLPGLEFVSGSMWTEGENARFHPDSQCLLRHTQNLGIHKWHLHKDAANLDANSETEEVKRWAILLS